MADTPKKPAQDRLSGAPLAERTRRIIAAYHEDTESFASVLARKLDVSAGIVRRVLAAEGLVFKHPHTDIVANRVGEIGSTRVLLLKESPEFRQWLRDNMPVGSTVAELLVSIAVDTFEEERVAANTPQPEGT